MAPIFMPSITFAEDELLDADKAYQFSAVKKDNQTLQLTWRIAKGYYLYKNKFKFSVKNDAIKLGNATFPNGKIKHDEFFGEIEIYRNQVNINLPFKLIGNSTVTSFDIHVRSQGCADIGVCYPPHRQQATIKMDAQTISLPTPTLKNLLQPQPAVGLWQQDEILPANKAFVFSAVTGNNQTIHLHWDIADGYYLYSDKLKIKINHPDVTLRDYALPAGINKNDEFFGNVTIYKKRLDISVTPLYKNNTPPAEIILEAHYQGCAEVGICYPPITKTIPILLPTHKTAIQNINTGNTTSSPDTAFISEQDKLAKTIAESNIFLTALTFLGIGLMLAFTPCIFPTIPILSGIIIGQGEHLSQRKGFMLSLVYVLAMSVTNTIAGILVGKFGANIQSVFQQPWIIISLAAVFVTLSLSMFGFYNLQMPSTIQTKLATFSNQQKSGEYLGVAIMGLLSALIITPCAAAPLAGALIYIGHTGDAVLGGISLFAMSIGMGLPLLVIGASAGKLLPKAGHWMNAIKAIFGVLLLAIAIWLLERIYLGPLTLLLWGILLITSGVYMGALEQIPIEDTGWAKLWKGLGLSFIIYGAALILGAATGGSDALQPFAKINTAHESTTQNPPHQFTHIKSIDDLNQHLKIAKNKKQWLMLDFYADWCVSCKELEKYTFSDANIQNKLSHLHTIQADVTQNDDIDQALQRKLNVIGPPTILFFDPNGKEHNNYRIIGYLNPDDFLAHLSKIK